MADTKAWTTVAARAVGRALRSVLKLVDPKAWKWVLPKVETLVDQSVW